MLEVYLTGIKQNSGVTLITAGIAATMQGLGYSTAVYIPAQSGVMVKDGVIQAPDVLLTKFMDRNIQTYCSYLYKGKPLTPQVYENENLYMDKNVIFQDYMNIVNKYECAIVTGQSNLNTLIETDFTEEELLKTIAIPIVVIASLKNTTREEIINYLNMVKMTEMNLRGVIINECPSDLIVSGIRTLQQEIELRTGCHVLGIIPTIPNLNRLHPEDWIEYIICRTDLEAIFHVKIAKLSG